MADPAKPPAVVLLGHYGIVEEIRKILKFSTEVNLLAEAKKANYRGLSKSVPAALIHVSERLNIFEQHMAAFLQAAESLWTGQASGSPTSPALDEALDGRGAWRIFAILSKRLLWELMGLVSQLPFIVVGKETTQEFVRRKLISKRNMPKILDLMDSLRCLTQSIEIMNKVAYFFEMMTEEVIQDLLTTLYLEPFWYSYDPYVSRFKSVLTLVKTTMATSYKESNFITRSFAQARQGVSWLLSTQRQVSKTAHELGTKEASVEYLKSFWNLTEGMITSTLISLIKPWIKVSVIVAIPVDKETEAKGFKQVRVLINSSRPLPFSIPPSMMRESSKENNESSLNAPIPPTNVPAPIAPVAPQIVRTCVPLGPNSPLPEIQHLASADAASSADSADLANPTEDVEDLNQDIVLPHLSADGMVMFCDAHRKLTGEAVDDGFLLMEDSSLSPLSASQRINAAGPPTESPSRPPMPFAEVAPAPRAGVSSPLATGSPARATHSGVKMSPEGSIGTYSPKTFVPPTLNPEPKHVPVILHFHGGGFMAGSPSTHETYLREFAKATGAIVFSVEYTKSPEAKYPQALEECFFFYTWILSETNALGIVPSKFVVCGDSAGGNLALAVTYKAIQQNLRLPDALILAYPALDLTKSATASRVLFSNDVLLPYYFMMVCLDAYAAAGANGKDFLLSPLYAPPEILKKLPENLVILSAGYDPLLDDSVRFLQKLDKVRHPYKWYLYELPHGFWNFAGAIPKANAALSKTLEHLVAVFR